MSDTLVPLVFFIFLGAIILGPRYLRYCDRRQMHRTMRAAMEQGQTLSPEMIAMIQSSTSATSADAYDGAPELHGGVADPGRPGLRTRPLAIDLAQRDLRRGVIWLAVGLGFVGLGVGLHTSGQSTETLGAFAAIGAIPAFVGLAFIALWFFNRNTSKL